MSKNKIVKLEIQEVISDLFPKQAKSKYLEVRKLYNIDCRKIVKKLPPNSLIISDPPYNIGFEYPEYNDKMKIQEYVEMFKKFKKFPCIFINYPEEMIKFICTALGNPEEIVAWVYPSNIARQHRMIAWFNCKPDFSKVKQPYKSIKDKRVLELINKGSIGTNIYDWWEINLVKNVSNEKQDYTNQIPEEVIARIIKTTANKSNVIVDIFNGSGTTCVVADKLGFDWIGIDISSKAIEIAKKRINDINPIFGNGAQI